MLHHFDTTKKQFLGKSIQYIKRLSADSVRIAFTDGTSTTLSVYGDCCSTSIFYEIVIPDGCLESEILDLNENDTFGTDSEEVALEKVKAYGFDLYPEEQSIWDVTFRTKEGKIRIRHINSSNGYYDGSTSFSPLE